ncbi:MAG: TraR/DksA family transcriptional regulator [Planctomycetota bacterium]|nr:TraR/DksA family transcriptional regulator [Planctomycetota bacterium]
MAKKSTTKKKARPVSRRKVTKTTPKKPRTSKKVAPSAAKRSAGKASGRQTTAIKAKADRPGAKPTAKKVSSRRTTKKTTAGKKPRTAKVKTAGRSTAKPFLATPDAEGYVIINGRRIRMISKTETPAANKKPSKENTVAADVVVENPSTKPIKTKLSKKDLSHFRTQLLLKRAELVGDLSTMEAQALRAGGGNPSHMPIHMADVGTDTYDQDFMLGLAEAERHRLREIDEALQRIDDRTYGVCQMTSKPIPKARLNAKPWAKYSIEAAREIERGLSE